MHRSGRGCSRLPTREGSNPPSSAVPRSRISAPFGPVHRRNGAALQRSEALTVVKRISSCSVQDSKAPAASITQPAEPASRPVPAADASSSDTNALEDIPSRMGDDNPSKGSSYRLSAALSKDYQPGASSQRTTKLGSLPNPDRPRLDKPLPREPSSSEQEQKSTLPRWPSGSVKSSRKLSASFFCDGNESLASQPIVGRSNVTASSHAHVRQVDAHDEYDQNSQRTKASNEQNIAGEGNISGSGLPKQRHGPHSLRPLLASFNKYQTSPAQLSSSRGDRVKTERSNVESIPPSQNESDFASIVEDTTLSIKDKAYPLAPLPKARLSRSRTLTVLTNLTASISRVSLSSSERKISSSSKTSNNTANTAASVASREATPASPLASEEAPTSTNREESSHLKDPNAIYESQPSAYWSGRFMAINDRLQTEVHLNALSMRELQASKKDPQPNRNWPTTTKRGFIPQSNTSAGLTTLPTFPSPRTLEATISVSNPITTAPSKDSPHSRYCGTEQFSAKDLEGEESRALAVFARLKELCATDEAARSLWVWQQAYARKKGKQSLLPSGGSMVPLETRKDGVVARFLGRRSLGVGEPRSLDAKRTPSDTFSKGEDNVRGLMDGIEGQGEGKGRAGRKKRMLGGGSERLYEL